MNELLVKSFDFGIRIVELAGYLEEENKRFPLIDRLLQCAEELCVQLRVLQHLRKKTQQQCLLAYKLATHAEYLLELMVITGFLSELQSAPILADCRFLKSETEKLLKASDKYVEGL
jgi:hypothetical protein